MNLVGRGMRSHLVEGVMMRSRGRPVGTDLVGGLTQEIVMDEIGTIAISIGPRERTARARRLQNGLVGRIERSGQSEQIKPYFICSLAALI